MGEYIKYRGEETKIGTCEDLYYATYPKYIAALHANEVSALEGNCSPEEYAKPNAGFRFRFPFPDEDHLSIGSLEYDFSRGVPIKLDAKVFESLETHHTKESVFQMEITQQKLVFRESDGKLCLALVWRNPETGKSSRIEEDADIKAVLKQILKHHIQNENDPKQKLFYHTIAARTLQGYKISEAQELKRKTRNTVREIFPMKNSAQKRKK